MMLEKMIKKMTSELEKRIIRQVKKAKDVANQLINFDTNKKNNVLEIIADELENNKDIIIKYNKSDIENAIESRLNKALIDRLTLNEKRIIEMCNGVRNIAKLNDPVGEVISEWVPPSGIRIKKVRVPIGVICMIYESRPNVTVDSVALCLKSGNAVILRGGSETINTNRILITIIKESLKKAKFPVNSVQFIDTPDRKAINVLSILDEYIDLIILRGGEQMIRSIRRKATVPIIAHGKGLCHTYIDKDADINKAIKIAYNAKVQRPGVCNAMETLLVHKEIAEKILPPLAAEYKKSNVELRGCKKTLKILKDIKPAVESDWSTEYLSLILSIKIVDSIEDAIKHINTYGSKHSESIVTENISSAEKFLREVDASAVFHNASTRLHDGGVFGLGAEIGISTQKLHARGTMGLKELTTTKYIVYGTGQIRE
jgi:glutamate-5-semialdehyde dehydrogenase